MAIWNLGSINADLFYSVPHLPSPGETLASIEHRKGLGGKGANISVAAARAAGRVHHIGAVGSDGLWARDLLLEYGVDTRHISETTSATGHAVIAVDTAGENNIILCTGANGQISETAVQSALSEGSTGDWFVCQNETNAQAMAAKLAKQMGLSVAYVAAPFEAAAVTEVLPYLDLLILNQLEADQLSQALNQDIADLQIQSIVVTLGARGAMLYSSGLTKLIEPVSVDPIDSTGAGDTFAGYLIACLDRGLPINQALTTANLAAAIMVTRHGTADVIPDLKDIEDFKKL
ncbi:MAG: ribokinase [Paracoccaceae bacterium]